MESSGLSFAWNARITKVMELAEKQGHFSVKGLAAAVNLSPSRLEQLFKQTTGEQISHHLAQLRLRKAARLLESTGMSIKEITYAVGYEHRSSFVRAFRRTYESSPRTYRKSYNYNARTIEVETLFAETKRHSGD